MSWQAPDVPRSPVAAAVEAVGGVPVVCTAACSVLAACVWGAITAQVGTVAAACGAALAAVCVAAAVLDSLLVARARWQQRSRAASLKQLPGPSYNEGRPAWVDRERGLLDSLVTLAAHHRSAFKVWFGSVPCVVIAQPDDVNFVVKSNERLFDKGTDYDIARVIIGGGMLTSSGAVWKTMRKASRKLFGMKSLSKLAADMEAHMAELQQCASTGRTDDALLTFATQSKSSPSASPHDLVLNVYDHAMLTLIAATCTHFFSVDVSPTTTLMLARHVTVLVEGMRKEMEALHEPVQWWRVLPININPHKRAMLHAQQCLQQWALGHITQRRAMTEDKRPNDLLSAWVSACDSDTQVMDEMLSVLLVGHDASSACIAWTAYLLMKNPEVQQQLALEVDACRSDDDLQRAPLLTAVLKESMRLYPPAAVYGRRPLKDVHLPDGLAIPAGTFMLVAPYIAHRTPVWPHATSFKPDRFLSCPSGDADSSSPAPAFYPFSYGPRNCIGQVAAMVEMRVYVARLVQSLRLVKLSASATDSCRAPLPELSGLVIRPQGGMRLVVCKRQR